VTSVEVGSLASDGRCGIYLDADGSRITRLSAHIYDDTVMRTVEYPAESRAVVELGDTFAGSVSVFIGAAELARLIDALNAAYTRIACQPHEDEPSPDRGAA
jgi:hypothetical protein